MNPQYFQENKLECLGIQGKSFRSSVFDKSKQSITIIHSSHAALGDSQLA